MGRVGTRRRSITAAVPARSSMNGRDGIISHDVTADWQAQAWDYYDTVGELRYVCQWLSNALSRCNLVASDVDPETGQPTGETDDETVQQVVAAIAGGPAGQTRLLSQLATYLTVPGAAWVAILNRGDGEEWHVLSTDEVQRRAGGGTVTVSLPDGTDWQLDEQTDTLAPIWIPHPREQSRPDSLVRACLPILREIVRLGQHVEATAKSRLASNGVLAVPNEMSLPNQASPGGDPDAPYLPPPAPDDPGYAPAPEDYGQVTSAGDFADAMVDSMSTAMNEPDSAAALVPIILQGPGDQLQNMKHIGLGTEFTDTVIRLREAATRRLAISLDVPPEVLLGTAGVNHWCHDEDTEVLTLNGWRRHDAVQVGDVVLTLNHETGLSEWKPVLDIYRADVTDEPMLRMRSTSHDSLSTEGHRWPIVKARAVGAGASRRRWTTTGDGFADSDRVPVSARCASLPDTPKYSDAMVKLAAIYTADGTVLYESGSRRPYVRIAKFDHAQVAELRGVLSDVFGRRIEGHAHPTKTVAGTAFALRQGESAALMGIAEGANKIISRQFVNELTEAQLSLFIDTMVRCGDGARLGQSVMLYQVVPDRLDAFEHAGMLLGYRATRGVRSAQTGYGTEPLSWLRLSPSRGTFRPAKAEQTWQSYTGTIWCPTTENGTWYARRGGAAYFTGNSAWQIEESAVKLHVEPLLTTICDRLTEAVLRPLLRMEGHPDPESVVLWFSTANLTRKANDAAEALTAWKSGAVDVDVYRRAAGFDATEQPRAPRTDRERAELAYQLVMRDPSLLPMLGGYMGMPVQQPAGGGGASADDAPDRPVEGPPANGRGL